MTLGGVEIHVSHGHELGRPTAELAAGALSRRRRDLRPHAQGGRSCATAAAIAFNPGAAGPRRFDLQPSVARLTITAGDPPAIDVEIISLA